MPKKLKNKVTIITGGAQGIGKATAEVFALNGAKVVIWDINEVKGRQTEEEYSKAGLTISFAEVDTTKFDLVCQAAKKVFEEYGKIDILINNAGIARDASLLKMTLDQWQQVIDVNLTGVFNCTKAIAPFMVGKKNGRIINTSSLIGMYGSDIGQTNFAAAKSGVIGITKVWARELSKQGITVNAVSPGFIETDTLRNTPEEVVKSIRDKIPVGRLGQPADIANAYLFLASDEASYISGAVLNVDGGYVA